MQAVRTSKPWPRVSVSSTVFQRFCTRGVLRTAPKRSVGVRAPLFSGPIRPRRELQYKRYRWRLYFCRRLLRWFLRTTPRLQKAAYPVETSTPPCFSDCPGTHLSPRFGMFPGSFASLLSCEFLCRGNTVECRLRGNGFIGRPRRRHEPGLCRDLVCPARPRQPL